jgi:hypothetical protein
MTGSAMEPFDAGRLSRVKTLPPLFRVVAPKQTVPQIRSKPAGKDVHK